MGIYDKLSKLEEKTKKEQRPATPPSQPEKPTTTPKHSVLTRLNHAKSGDTVEPDQISHEAEKKPRNEEIQQTSNIASNIAILQLTNEDIEDLKEPSYQPQTYRLSEREIEWIKDTAYRLSKEIRRGKVSQVDILRIAIKLFENSLATNKADLIEILEKIK